ncbi:MAG: hypothetical protein IJS96_09265 [Schwartzia sp.]|nr:hypothetical protein [Schwartzia sp. (in: firmicutes)]
MTTFSVGSLPYRVRGRILHCGEDIVAIVTGGTRPHIGAVALAEPRASLTGNGHRSASASVLCRLGHKDDLWARDAALSLAAAAGVPVVVTVGIHIDDADSETIARLRESFEVLLEQMKQSLVERKTSDNP